MSTSGKTHDDGLRGLLRDRFEDFEPEAPELFNAIADSRLTAAKQAVRRFVPGIIAVMLLLVTHPLDDRFLPQEINTGRIEEQAYPAEPALHTAVDQLIGRNEGSRTASRNDNRATRRVTFAEAGAPGQSAAEPMAAITDGDLPAPGSAPDYTPLLPPAMQFSSGLVARPVAAAKDERQEESPVKMRKGRLSVHGALGVNYTQYLLTVLPQENMSIGDLSFPDPGEKVNWRLQGSLGINYDKWQLRLTYQEFTQKLSFLENRGNVEVAYSGAGDYTITPVTVQVSSEKNFRVAGLYLRRIQPVKSTGLYIGAGAGYLAGLKGEHQGIWGQAFAGHHKRLSPTMDFFYETQFNYSFRPFRLADPSLTFRPYQVGLSAGIRWNRGNR
ncbi:MAG: hypothetical protein ABS46_18785 [Cytophagaceae bacterium SCN 52-12]|nr:MAG: hypothetical protein ABS46_18785 [Cytophagaceae bacterium SCN 52-12]